MLISDSPALEIDVAAWVVALPGEPVPTPTSWSLPKVSAADIEHKTEPFAERGSRVPDFRCAG